MNERTSRTKAKVLAVLMAAAVGCGVIVYVLFRGRGRYRNWELAGMSFVLPDWKEKTVIPNTSFGAVELLKEDGTAGLVVRWERLRVNMTIPVQTHIVSMVSTHLRSMSGRSSRATAAGEDVLLQVGPHKGRRREFTFDAPRVRQVASISLWTCARTERFVTFGIFDEDGAEFDRVEKRFLGSVDCHARPVYHKERIRLCADLPGDWRETVFTGSTKTFVSGDGNAFLVLAAFASSGEKRTADDARGNLNFFASGQLGLSTDRLEAKSTYLRKLGHPGAEASADVLERFRPLDSRVRLWLWTCEEDKADYMALFLAYGGEAVKLMEPVLSTLRCHAGEPRPQKGWQRVRF